MADGDATHYKMASLIKRPGSSPSIVIGQLDIPVMNIDVRIDASPNDWRRFFGAAIIVSAQLMRFLAGCQDGL